MFARRYYQNEISIMGCAAIPLLAKAWSFLAVRSVTQKLETYLNVGLLLSAHDLRFNVLNTALKLLDTDRSRTDERVKLSGQYILRSKQDEEAFKSIFYGKLEE